MQKRKFPFCPFVFFPISQHNPEEFPKSAIKIAIPHHATTRMCQYQMHQESKQEEHVGKYKALSMFNFIFLIREICWDNLSSTYICNTDALGGDFRSDSSLPWN